MSRDQALQHIRALGVVPIVRASSSGEATRAAAAIRAAGVDIVEITMTVPGALRIIEELAGRGDTLAPRRDGARRGDRPRLHPGRRGVHREPRAPRPHRRALPAPRRGGDPGGATDGGGDRVGAGLWGPTW